MKLSIKEAGKKLHKRKNLLDEQKCFFSFSESSSNFKATLPVFISVSKTGFHKLALATFFKK